MNSPPRRDDVEPEVPPLYAVTDWRTDGRKRILATYVHPDAARAHADALRAAGDAAEVELVSAIRDGE